MTTRHYARLTLLIMALMCLMAAIYSEPVQEWPGPVVGMEE